MSDQTLSGLSLSYFSAGYPRRKVIENLTVAATFTYSLGIEDVRCDSDRQYVVYDLQGHLVRELVPGNVYIRDGKKFIFKGEK